MRLPWIGAVALASACLAASAEAAPTRAFGRTASPGRGPGFGPVRGLTIGPIENAYHTGVGYGSDAYLRTVEEAMKQGATWVALTPFGRVGSLAGLGIDPTFEAPFADNRRAVERAVRQAHAYGLRVMLVPHLWVESGEWRAKIDPGTDAGWKRWQESYTRYLLAWADVAERSQVDLLSLGVELRSWVTTTRAPSFVRLAGEVRTRYRGPLTYSGNWDDVADTCIWSAVDVVGINAFFPLTDHDGATPAELWSGGEKVQTLVQQLFEDTGKPVLFTEMGYTTRPNPAKDPWEWPDAMKGVVVDQPAQAEAYRGLLGPAIENPRGFAGFFVWRVYADPDDVSQEAEWGFSPRGKLAEVPLREAFGIDWASERTHGELPRHLDVRTLVPGLY